MDLCQIVSSVNTAIQLLYNFNDDDDDDDDETNNRNNYNNKSADLGRESSCRLLVLILRTTNC